MQPYLLEEVGYLNQGIAEICHPFFDLFILNLLATAITMNHKTGMIGKSLLLTYSGICRVPEDFRSRCPLEKNASCDMTRILGGVCLDWPDCP